MNNIPEILLEGREMIECNFIFSVYKELEVIPDYKSIQSGRDITTKDGRFYWELANAMYKNGYKTIDNLSVYTFLDNKKEALAEFENRGGWKTLEEIMMLVNIDNRDAYYDELCKSNLLINLWKAGFDVLDNLEKFKTVSSEDVYNYYDYQLQNIAVDKIEKIKTEDLSDGYEEYIEEWDKGAMVGYPIATKMLNYQLAGVHKKNLMLHLGGIGQGKTTTAVIMYVISAIKNGENVLIIANEEGCSAFRQTILATVLFNEVGDIKGLKMNRQKFTTGRFTPQQKEKLNEAAKWIKAQKGKATFVDMQDYSISNVRKIIKKYSKLGYGLVIYDTLKPVSDASDRSWGEFSDTAKELFLLSKKCDVAIIATAQMTPDAVGRQILDLSCVGKSRAIAETCGTVIGFRPVRLDEISKLKPYTYETRDDGIKTKTIHSLNEDKHYVIWFVMKNRFGATSPNIVMEFDQAFCRLKEIGYLNF